MVDFSLSARMGYEESSDTNGPGVHSVVGSMSTNESDPGSNHISITDNLAVQAAFIVCYSVIFVIGITGNALVVHVVAKNRHMQTVTNVFIANLAASDILMCLLAVPFTSTPIFMNKWIFGEALCHLVPMIQGISVYVSTCTSLAIAVDRYFVIVHPFKPRMNLYVCFALIFIIWVVSISISIPLAIFIRLKPATPQILADPGLGDEASWPVAFPFAAASAANRSSDVVRPFGSGPNRAPGGAEAEPMENYICTESWPPGLSRRFFTITSLILQYVIPFGLITYSYVRVSLALSQRVKLKPGQSRQRDMMELKRKRRTNRMLIAMVTIFAICWLPLNGSHVAIEIDYTVIFHPYYLFYFFVAHVIAMSSACYNPFLYSWLNENFRKEFKATLPCLFSFAEKTTQIGKSITNYSPRIAVPDTQQSLLQSSPNPKIGLYPPTSTHMTQALNGSPSHHQEKLNDGPMSEKELDGKIELNVIVEEGNSCSADSNPRPAAANGAPPAVSPPPNLIETASELTGLLSSTISKNSGDHSMSFVPDSSIELGPLSAVGENVVDNQENNESHSGSSRGSKETVVQNPAIEDDQRIF